jgi:general secretion pathway protein A
MIDEAQHLSPEVLEEIRLLSNFETDEAKLLQIVLVGQPDLGELLRRPDLQQLAQRVARHCELHPLSEREVADYVERRLTVAASPTALSGQGEPVPAETANAVRFSAPALKTVADISGGMPRIVNVLCDRAIEAAYVREVRVVDPDAVMTAAGQLRLAIADDVIVPTATRRLPLVVAIVVVLALAAGALWWWQHQKAPAPAGPPPASTVAPMPAPSAADAPVAPPATSAPDAAPVLTPASTGPRTPGDRPTTTSAAPGAAAPAAAPAARPDLPPGSFTIAVASFRTESRAHDVETAITAMGLPVVVRPDTTGTWSVVTAGPFATRADAAAAQDTLTNKGYPNTRIVPAQP